MSTGSWRRQLRWMYRGGRPNRLARVLNGLAARQHSAGLGPRHWVTLEVRGRRSGRTVALPLVVADHEGERYLVSMLGDRVNWVANVRAADGRAVLRHRGREAVRLVEVDVADRPPILRRHLALAPGARPHVPVDRHAPLTEFARVAPTIPVFRIVADRPAPETAE
ncbi:nitroreductase/quinone reductase family protein [Micromonospora robiginosa]|uniref:Nitroreductase/quinone reductase family protein n=1 Tax=Micromonospora robiginosa TaxID=2749844 RepID=A0A7L6BFQ0_9ACTN|nr:nitroreductase/quinone reductase family protein [Micromonospora ferruginea]QLQ40480.2 nitroreductase/quinone reductase family protein [Micromonospora ferruginea]